MTSREWRFFQDPERYGRYIGPGGNPRWECHTRSNVILTMLLGGLGHDAASAAMLTLIVLASRPFSDFQFQRPHM